LPVLQEAVRSDEELLNDEGNVTSRPRPWKRKRRVNARLRAFRLRCARRKFKQIGINLEE
jgi:hypothetical protein